MVTEGAAKAALAETLQRNLIPIDALEGPFHRFINVHENKRIFFSGRFGTGKTYFLKAFFEAHRNEYEAFHIFPVRYQISGNDDIIDLLKYDILIELLNKNKDIFEGNEIKGLKDHIALFIAFCREKGSLNDFLQSVLDTGQSVAQLSSDPFTQFFAKLGRPLQDLLNFDKEFQKFKQEYKAGEKGAVQKFTEEVRAKDVSETDYLSYLLREKIAQQKGSKRSVLILDDMDRIDPDQVFRILNVFSAHFDNQDNKFGFDHVIMVADIKNIESIFHHKYGPTTDFWGYFDKFFSVKPYYLNNSRSIAERIPELVKEIKYEEVNLKEAIGESGYIKLLLSEVLNRSLAVNALNLRQLYKPVIHNFTELQSGTFAKDSFGDSFQQLLDIGVKVLIAIFGGDGETFVSVLKKIRASISNTDDLGRAPYAAYIGAMMKELVQVKAGTKTAWNDYYFTAPGDLSARNFQVDGIQATQAKFFYDALIEYVGKGKYIKNSKWDYDNR